MTPIMHCLTMLLAKQDDEHVLLAQQIFLLMSLEDLMECKRVSKIWQAHVERLFKKRCFQWSHLQMARKTSAAMHSVVEGTVVQKVHLNAYCKRLTKRNYWLSFCVLYKGVFILHFTKVEAITGRNKYWLLAIAQHNIHKIQYAKKYAAVQSLLNFPSGGALLIWWYILEGDNDVKLHFTVIDEFTHFNEKSYTMTIRLKDFVSPSVAFNELLSGDCSLRTEIQMTFPELNYHTQLTSPNTINASMAHFDSHEIFYYTKPTQDITELWVIDNSAMEVVIKRSIRKREWTCNSENLQEIQLQACRFPVAIFYIKASNSFAVWDLSQPGHLRHISLDVQLPTELSCVFSHTNNSKWIISLYQVEGTYYVYADFPFKLKNSLIPCECNISGTRACHMEPYKLRASISSLLPTTYVHFVGDRFIIQRARNIPKIYLHDCWKNSDGEHKSQGFIRRCVTFFKSM